MGDAAPLRERSRPTDLLSEAKSATAGDVPLCKQQPSRKHQHTCLGEVQHNKKSERRSTMCSGCDVCVCQCVASAWFVLKSWKRKEEGVRRAGWRKRKVEEMLREERRMDQTEQQGRQVREWAVKQLGLDSGTRD